MIGRAFILMAIVSVLSGCVSIAVHVTAQGNCNSKKIGYYYLGSRVDAYTITSVVPDGVHIKNHDKIRVKLFSLIDLPFSFVLDTILLPVDYMKTRDCKNGEEGKVAVASRYMANGKVCAIKMFK